MADIIIYQKPTCSTCRKVIQLTEASAKSFKTVNYYEKPFSKAKLQDLLKKGRLKTHDILRTKEDIYKTLKSKIATLGETEIIELMVKHPDLIQRPLVEKGDKVILARPPETVNPLLSGT